VNIVEPPSGRVAFFATSPGRPPWHNRAACLTVEDPSIFFPSRGDSTGQAKAICSGCAVRADCLAFALATRELHGIWGGRSERERRALRRRHGAPGAA
jgi:WhiB family redox-sensing transcriptional regulator